MGRNLKLSINQYRNIKGVYFENWSFDESKFEEFKAEAKKEGLKFRIIKGEFYREKK